MDGKVEKEIIITRMYLNQKVTYELQLYGKYLHNVKVDTFQFFFEKYNLKIFI